MSREGDQMKVIALLSVSVAALVTGLHAAPAQALIRTWVASTGTGSACTRAAPCSNFQAAHDVTDPNGEINCVDGNQYPGALDINKSITIDCAGTIGGI